MPIVSQFTSPALEYSALSELNLHSLIVGRHQSSFYFAYAEGCGLESAGIFANDLLCCDRAETPKHKDIVVAMANGEFLVRYFDAIHQQLRADHSIPIPLDDTVVIEAVVVQSIRCLRPLQV